MASARRTAPRPEGRPGPRAPIRERAVPAVTRAAAILRVLSRSEAPLGVQAIARELKLVPSTCLHILRALVAEELVAVDPDTRRYRLDTGLLSLAHGMLRQSGFPAVATPMLQGLSQRLGVTAIGLEVRGLDHVVVVAISRAREPFHIHVDLGSRFPALISASGRVLGAFGGHPEAELRARFAAVRWDRPPTFAEWKRQVAEARDTGYGVDQDRYILGVTVLSAPVVTEGRISHMLVVVGLSERLRDRIGEIGRALVDLSADLARRLNG